MSVTSHPPPQPPLRKNLFFLKLEKNIESSETKEYVRARLGPKPAKQNNYFYFFLSQPPPSPVVCLCSLSCFFFALPTRPRASVFNFLCMFLAAEMRALMT